MRGRRSGRLDGCAPVASAVCSCYGDGQFRGEDAEGAGGGEELVDAPCGKLGTRRFQGDEM